MEEIIENKVKSWLEGGYDDSTKEIIRELISSGNEEELTESFYKDLEFGTGGLRGIMGVGSNRINKYTIGAATQGLANYLIATYPNDKIKVAVAHDSRNNSNYFASIVRDVFSANGIKVYFFTELRPTPELSFAIRHYGCKSGVVITASHNPKEYNGYKAYWDDGAQVLAPHDKNIIQAVSAISNVSKINFDGNDDLVENILEETDEAFIKEVEGVIVNKELIEKHHDVSIVYTPIHGTGITLVPKTLKKLGFTNVHLVDEQLESNGDFPSVVYPNPEEEEAMSIALQKGKELNADIIMATDPDADRVGIGIKNLEGDYVLMNGNQTGAMIYFYLLNAWKEKQLYTGKEYTVSTIVTTDLLDEIATHYGLPCYRTLTGFKYIADVIKKNENEATFICGGEESYGYMIGGCNERIGYHSSILFEST